MESWSVLHNIEWFKLMLDHLKTLDMNNFLHDVSPYVVNLQRVQALASIACTRPCLYSCYDCYLVRHQSK
jgi:hypothetical protein